MKKSSNLSSHSLDSDFSSSCIGKSQPKNTYTYRYQHETILANLNQYMAMTHLVIILMDDELSTHVFSY